MTTYAVANAAAPLDSRMSLLSWLFTRLGYDSAREMLASVRDADEGFDPDGRSHAYAVLAARESRLRELTPGDLARYDDNIREHLAAINAGRARPVTLRYFQYLAALCAEIYLDCLFKSPDGLLASLNRYVDSLNSGPARFQPLDRFARSDLNKLAFWMATGSGKTLLMHLNYRQFMRYKGGAPDNVLLITPNEGLSEQHLAELAESGITAARFDLNRSDLFSSARGAVQVTEITKLVLEKKGEGESVPVDAFDGDNLIFVDEGHKGTRVEGRDGVRTWRAVRDALGETGFTFEYSATFGQALTAARDDALTREYGKAIAFDYSYRHFYGDGYGKDFQIHNLEQETTADQTDQLLLANMLSFYEQQLVFQRRADALKPYNLERPLWVFVGSSVNAVRTEKGRPQSDVLTVARFFHRFLTEPGWATETIDRLFEGKSGLSNEHGYDLFADKLAYLRRLGEDAAAIYRGALETVLHATAPGALHVCDLRGQGGELGLKAGGADDYFGLIYVGDAPRFKRLVESSEPGIVVEEDAFSGSLFERINEPDSKVEALIGARRFIEGWNSWRVSNMGLLNIGRSEGSQIIQLFGRGVRLRGKGMGLKRSSAYGGDHPENLGLLETLNIFALRANYMAQFREYLEREGVSTESMIDLPLFIRPNPDFLDKGLVIPRTEDGRDFNADAWLRLNRNSAAPVSVDVSARVHTISSGATTEEGAASSGEQRTIPRQSLDLVDWPRVYRALLEHARDKGMDNLTIDSAELRRAMESDPPVYTLTAERGVVEPRSPDDLERLQDAVLGILRKYAESVYRRGRGRWESNHMVYKTLDDKDANFRFNLADPAKTGRYIVSVPGSDEPLVREVERLIADCDALYGDESGQLPRIHFDRHLYQPLLLEDTRDGLKMSPAGLNAGERQFVRHLKDYWRDHKDETPDDSELFLLRNQGRGAGVGFFENYGFYPDFILWHKTADGQRIVFIEPHGLIHADAYDHDEKARLHERLPVLARAISRRSRIANVSLDSYIVSRTGYGALKMKYQGHWSRDDFAEHHILFPIRETGYDYIRHILHGAQSE